jgi:hypothetical protein
MSKNGLIVTQKSSIFFHCNKGKKYKIFFYFFHFYYFAYIYV